MELLLRGSGKKEEKLLKKRVVVEDNLIKYSFDLTYEDSSNLREYIYQIAKTISDKGQVIKEINCTPVE